MSDRSDFKRAWLGRFSGKPSTDARARAAARYDRGSKDKYSSVRDGVKHQGKEWRDLTQASNRYYDYAADTKAARKPEPGTHTFQEWIAIKNANATQRKPVPTQDGVSVSASREDLSAESARLFKYGGPLANIRAPAPSYTYGKSGGESHEAQLFAYSDSFAKTRDPVTGYAYFKEGRIPLSGKPSLDEVKLERTLQKAVQARVNETDEDHVEETFGTKSVRVKRVHQRAVRTAKSTSGEIGYVVIHDR